MVLFYWSNTIVILLTCIVQIFLYHSYATSVSRVKDGKGGGSSVVASPVKNLQPAHYN
jgi:hypothetical protein